MDFTQAVRTVYRKYATFDGRAARSEYWWFVLFSILAAIAVSIVERALGIGYGGFMHGGGRFSMVYNGGILSTLWSLANFLPTLALAVRRLHDTDRSGWWLLIAFVPLVGAIVLFVFFCTRGTSGPNRFGPDPLTDPASH